MDNRTQEITNAISSERLKTYLDAASHDVGKALRLYKENALTAASFYPLLQGVEITLRNAINREMTARWGHDWFRVAPLGHKERDVIEKSLRHLPKDFTKGHLVADLSFGFWVRLLSTYYYQSLWVPQLYKCFKMRTHQKIIHSRFVEILTLRNRIAHYEPIFMRSYVDDRAMLLEAIGWLEPDMAHWLSK
jgi:hypothetical protein